MNHYRVIDRTKYQFDFLVLHEKEYPYAKEIQSLGGKIYFVCAPSINCISKFLKQAIALMKCGGYCAVHSHLNIENAWILVAARIAGIPVRISHSHDTVGKSGNIPVRMYKKIQECLIKKFATDFLACSEDAGNYLYGKAFFLKHGKVIHNGINTTKFLQVHSDEVKALRREFNLPAKTGPIIGNITRFEPKKNQLFVLEIFRAFLMTNPHAILILGGPDGGNLAQVKKHAQELEIEDHIRFIGPRDDVPACLHLLDVYLFPSIYEGLGIVLLEAQAAGCYCVASTGVSCESDIGINLVSYLELSKPAELWAEEISFCLNDRVHPSQENINSAFLASGFDICQSIKELVKVYDHQI